MVTGRFRIPALCLIGTLLALLMLAHVLRGEEEDSLGTQLEPLPAPEQGRNSDYTAPETSANPPAADSPPADAPTAKTPTTRSPAPVPTPARGPGTKPTGTGTVAPAGPTTRRPAITGMTADTTAESTGVDQTLPPGADTLTGQPAVRPRPQVPVVAPEPQITVRKHPGGRDTITLQIKNMDIMDVLRTLAEKGNLNIVAEEGVRGRITLFLNDVEITDALDIIAEMNDLAYIKEKNSIKVMTSKRYEELYGRPFGEKTSLRVFDLVNADAVVVANQLAPLKTKSGKIIPDPRTNVVMVIDTPVALEEMGSIVRTMDLPVATRAYSLKYASADAVVPAVKSILTPAGRVEVSKENNTLILTDIEENLDQAAILLGEFDSHQTVLTETFSFKYASHKAVLPIITGELTQGVGSVYADEKNNQLIVTDLPERMARIEELAKTLDKKTPQVLIEAKILQINLNDNTKLGVQWEAIQDRIRKFEEVGPVDVRLDYRILATSEQGTRVFAGGLDERDYEAMIEMLETTTETNLLSSPRITALNNETAEILVGSTVPYKTIDTREENGTIRTFEKVTMVDVGVKLSVTPTINEDGFITMKIKPEVSSIVAYSEGIPIVEKTQTETSVLVKDGVTIIIAGLVREERTETAKGVPFLKDIPILGIPFRSTDNKKVKSEIAIFITPHIITGDVSAEVPERE